MAARGWLALRFCPCAALRSCGRLDEHWCRARSAACDFPQVCVSRNDVSCRLQGVLGLQLAALLLYYAVWCPVR